MFNFLLNLRIIPQFVNNIISIKKGIVASTILFLVFTAFSGVRSQSKPVEICTEIYPASFNAAGIPDLYWKQKMIKIEFMNGSDFLKEKVRLYGNEWMKYANIKFAYIEDERADVRIAFNSGRSYSYIGIAAKDADKDEPTMNFGWFNEKTSEEEFRRVIQHEFGHLLGLIHEHQSPGATIAWDKTAVYNYYRTNFGWSRNLVDKNIFLRYSKKQTQFDKYDSWSIMQYPIPAELLLSGKPIPYNDNLSEGDKTFIKKAYP